MIRRRVAMLSLALASAASAGASSSDDPICTDRPGKGSATCAVPKGMWQIETGLADWSLTKDSGVRSASLTLGETAIKYGVGDRTHIEVGLAPYIRNRERGVGVRTSDRRFGDVMVKVKHELASDGAITAAIYQFVKLPVASKRIGNGKVEGGLVVPLNLAIAGTRLSLSSSPELDLVADGDGRGYHAAGATTLSLGIAADDRLSLAAELWTGWDWDEATSRQASLGGNAAYRMTDNLQIDGEVDLGLNRATADIEIAGGVSMRF